MHLLNFHNAIIVIQETRMYLQYDVHSYIYIHTYIHTVDREIFAVKLIRGLNFRVENILSLDGSAT